METDTLAISELIVFLVAAGLVVPLAQRFRVSPVLGFLLIGVLIGPHGLGRLAETYTWLQPATIDAEEGVHVLAEFGVVLLLFMIGLELSIERLWSLRRLVFGFGGAQVLVTGLAIGIVAYLFGNDAVASLVLGSCLALSSTAIVVQLLAESHRLGAPAGRASFSVLLFQDLAVVPILVLVGVLGREDVSSVPIAIGEAILIAVVAVAAIMVAGNLLIRPTFRLIGAVGSRELFMATVLLTILVISLLTGAAGLSMPLGAFLAGLLLADTEYRHQVEVDIEPFKGLFLGLFFLTVGMGVDPLAALANPLWVAASVVGLFALKGVILYVLARLFRLSRAIAVEVALTLGQAGEFAFVVIGLAVSLQILDPGTVQFILIVVGLSMVATPLVSRVARPIAARFEKNHAAGAPDVEEAVLGEISNHVVIAGYGRVGRLIGDLLRQEGIPFVALETDAGLVVRLRHEGVNAYVGDASRPEILERVGMERAIAFVVTMDGTGGAERIVAAVHRKRPRINIYARARDTAHAARLIAAGADAVFPETVEASLQLGEAVMIGAGLPEDATRTIIERRRREEEERYKRKG